MSGTYTHQSPNSSFTVSQRELAEFSKRFPETATFSNRIAELFWFNLYALEKDQGVDPNDVLREVLALEEGKPTFRKPTPFEREPLNGLMHTHWFSARFVPHNIVYELRADGIRNAAETFFPNGLVETDAIRDFADAITYAPFEQRQARGGLTGEWIIYAAEDQTYYLCCCSHKSGKEIHKDIIRYARRDFPQLKWFSENRDVIARVYAEDLDALFRKEEAKMIQVPTSDYSTNEVLCALDYDNLGQYCTNFLLAMLATLLQMDEIHLLDSFAMQSPKERLIAELKQRGLLIEAHLDELKTRGVKMTDFKRVRRTD
jgi:hypothetical protein